MSFGALPDGTTLFLDLDGVMADFDGGFELLFGSHPQAYVDAHGDDAMWERINDYGVFFQTLPIYPGALDFYKSVEHMKPVILTACPQENFANVAEQKRAWIRNHLGRDVPIVYTPGGKSKPLYMHRPNDILIDDFAANTARWAKAGGISILHEGDFHETAEKLAGVTCQKIRLASGTSHARSAAPATTSVDTTTATASASAAATTNQGVMPGFADHPIPPAPVLSRCW